MAQSSPAYRRILLKLSGEALLGSQQYGIDPAVIRRVAVEIAEVVGLGVQVGLVIGGGNIFRGAGLAEAGMDRVTADHMGMLATVINSLAMQDALERQGTVARVLSALQIHEVCEDYIRRRAMRHLEKGRVTIFAAGTGNPFFTTDTAASLRAIEIGADVLIKATKVDGVYSADPMKDPNAVRYRSLSFDQVLADQLRVMDATAIVMCRENNLPLVVFNLNNPGDLVRIVTGEHVGTSVMNQLAAHRNGQMINDIKKDVRAADAPCDRGRSRKRCADMRTGRAHAGLLEPVMVEYYGTNVPLKQTANISVEDARTIVVTPWEKQMVSAVEKAIINSGLGLNPVTAGQVIRVPLPPMTEERRREIVKVVRSQAENGRVAVRTARREALSDVKELLKEKLVTEDEDRTRPGRDPETHGPLRRPDRRSFERQRSGDHGVLSAHRAAVC